jgi:hypothetical protein
MINLWRRLVSTDVELVELDDFGFYEPERIKLYGPAYYRSGYHPGHLPLPGGILAQTKAVQHDLQVFMQGVAWAQYEASEREKAKA